MKVQVVEFYNIWLTINDVISILSMCFLSSVVQYCGLSLDFGWDSLLWTVADRLFIKSLKSVLMAFKNLADMSSRNVHDFSHEQKAV